MSFDFILDECKQSKNTQVFDMCVVTFSYETYGKGLK